MAMPSARTLTVSGRTYQYQLRAGKDGPTRTGWTSKTIRVVVEFRPGKFVSRTFLSKAWTGAHESEEEGTPPHKAAFTPADVRAMVKALEFHAGKLPTPFETKNWRLLPGEESSEAEPPASDRAR